MDNTLLEALKDEFNNQYKSSNKIIGFMRKYSKQNATLNDCHTYSVEISRCLNRALEKILNVESIPDGFTELICNQVIKPMLENNHSLVENASAEVQKYLNTKNGYSLGAKKATIDSHQIDLILQNISDKDISFDDAMKTLKDSNVKFTEASFDNFIRKNAEFKSDLGFKPVLIRTYEGAHKVHTGNGTDRHAHMEYEDCEWCMNLAGEYDYATHKQKGDEVYMRHEGCHCSVTYDDGKAPSKMNTSGNAFVK